jgi:hypothetical protein
MKSSGSLTVSLLCNLALGASLLLLRHRSAANPGMPASVAPPPAVATKDRPAKAAAGTEPSLVVPWREIESADYRQYIVNLRAVDCPEWLVRDIIVADIDDLYQQKTTADPVYSPPWQSGELRRRAARGRSARRNAIRKEKRALVKALLGYAWDNHAETLWNLDILTSLTLGFLPDEKTSQVLALRDEYTEAAQDVREDANFVIIDSDRDRLRSLFGEWQSDLARLLSPFELDELQLRMQQEFLIASDIHFEGLSVSSAELREIVRASKLVRDTAEADFVSERPLSKEEQIRRNGTFESQVKSLLGLERYADYQRAQDPRFREILEFGRQNQMTQDAAIQIYKARCRDEEQAREIENDGKLSTDERATALAVLQAATQNKVSSMLGGNYQSYLDGPGRWLDASVQSPQEPR